MNVSFLMKEYLSEVPTAKKRSGTSLFGEAKNNLPISVEKNTKWEILKQPERLSRSFNFKNSKKMMQFLQEVISYESEISHNGSILINGKNIKIDIYTHTLERVTELDLEYADEINKIYKDISDYVG
jgi:4a-hydroxytetrahydrobiopterin dehydratase